MQHQRQKQARQNAGIGGNLLGRLHRVKLVAHQHHPTESRFGNQEGQKYAKKRKGNNRRRASMPAAHALLKCRHKCVQAAICIEGAECIDRADKRLPDHKTKSAAQNQQGADKQNAPDLQGRVIFMCQNYKIPLFLRGPRRHETF